MESLRAVFVLIFTQVLYSTVESQNDPTLIVQVAPSRSYLLTSPGYNTVTLTCIATVFYVSGTQNLTVDWKKNSQVITDNGDDVIIDSLTHCEEYETNCESHLKLICREPGIFTYTCSIIWAYGTVKADAIVNVGGPVPPVKPHLLSATSSQDFCMKATITWTMNSVAYTPETYYVKYGTSSQELNNQSVTIYGSEDITTINTSYTVQIDGLSASTQYFYQVIASNSIGKTSSDTECFIECSTERCSTEDTTKQLTPILVPIFIFFIFSICMVIIMCVCCVKIRKRHHRNFNYVALCNEVANDVIEEPPPEYQEELPALIPDADPPNYEDQLRRHNVCVIPRPPLPPP